MGQDIATIGFASGFGVLMLVGLLFMIKAELVWVRSVLAFYVAVAAVCGALNFLFLDGRGVIVVEKPKPVEPTPVKPPLPREMAAAMIAANYYHEENKRRRDAGP